MIQGQFSLIHIPPFSHQIYFNIMVFYNPTNSACDYHTRGFPTNSMALSCFLLFFLDRQKMPWSIFIICPDKHTLTPLPCRKT